MQHAPQKALETSPDPGVVPPSHHSERFHEDPKYGVHICLRYCFIRCVRPFVPTCLQELTGKLYTGDDSKQLIQAEEPQPIVSGMLLSLHY